MIDEEYSGGFTDYYLPDLVKVRQGVNRYEQNYKNNA